MFLGEVTETYYDHCCQDLGYGWKEVELFNEELDEYVIEGNTNDHEHKVAQQLNSSP